MATISTSELRKLDVQPRLKIIDELWESVVAELNDPDKPNSFRSLTRPVHFWTSRCANTL